VRLNPRSNFLKCIKSFLCTGRNQLCSEFFVGNGTGRLAGITADECINFGFICLGSINIGIVRQISTGNVKLTISVNTYGTDILTGNSSIVCIKSLNRIRNCRFSSYLVGRRIICSFKCQNILLCVKSGIQINSADSYPCTIAFILSLLLQEELVPLRKKKTVTNYDLENEYAKTRKNKDTSIWLTLGLTVAAVVLLTWGIVTKMSATNRDIEVSLNAFEDK